MQKFLWVLVIIGSIIGALTLIVGLGSAGSAPQEAAVAGISLAWAVIPYCLARAAQLHGQAQREEMRDPRALLVSIDSALKDLLQAELAKKKEREGQT